MFLNDFSCQCGALWAKAAVEIESVAIARGEQTESASQRLLSCYTHGDAVAPVPAEDLEQVSLPAQVRLCSLIDAGNASFESWSSKETAKGAGLLRKCEGDTSCFCTNTLLYLKLLDPTRQPQADHLRILRRCRNFFHSVLVISSGFTPRLSNKPPTKPR